jgi:hypothetical protein
LQAFFFLSLWIAAAAVTVLASSYAEAGSCARCHDAISRTYLQTGMGRSFSPPAALPKLEAFYHSRSDRHYAVVERDGRWFIRRHQIGYKGGVANEVEREIHYAIGSGDHARSFLSRTPSGTFVELPLTWYAEGARWGMSPGYDTTEHQDFRRRISDSCLFCHNGYPEAAASGLAAGSTASAATARTTRGRG